MEFPTEVVLGDLPESAIYKTLIIKQNDCRISSGFLDSSKETNVSPKLQLRIRWSQNLWKPDNKPHKSLGDPNLQFSLELHENWRTTGNRILILITAVATIL